MIRAGQVESVAVEDLDELIRLRTELAILDRFGQGSNDQVIAAIAASLEEAEQTDETPDHKPADLKEMLQILRDAANPVVAETVAAIDADFPQAAQAMQIETIEQEAEAFHVNVAGGVLASGLPDAVEVSQSYLTAVSARPHSPSDTDVVDNGDDPVSETEEARSDSGDDVVSSSDVEAAVEVQPDSPADEAPAGDPAAASPSIEAGVTVEPEVSEQADPVPATQPEDAAPEPAADAAESSEDIDALLDSLTAEAEEATGSAEPIDDDEVPLEQDLAEALVAQEVPNDEDVELPATEPDAPDAVGATDEAALSEQALGDLVEEVTAEAVADDSVDVEDQPADPAEDVDKGPTPMEVSVDAALDVADAAVKTIATDFVGGEDEPAPIEPSADEAPADAGGGLEPAATGSVADELRAEVDDIRRVLTDQLDRLTAVLERVEQVSNQAQQTLGQANRLREAAESARDEAAAALEAQKTYVQAQKQADRARAASEQAQARAETARQALESTLADQADT